MADPHYYEPDELGNLLALCYCACHYVRVPQQEVRAGRTKTCGEPQCRQAA